MEDYPGMRGGLSAIMAGVVTDNKNAEKKGLLQVRIPLLEEGGDLLEEVRLLQPYAGKAVGMYLVPEIGDLVLVALVNSSLGRAFVLGSFPPEGAAFTGECFDENNNRKVFATRGGTRLAISDEEGKESLEVTTPGQLSLLLHDESKTAELCGEDGKTSLLLNMESGEAVLQADSQLDLICGDSRIRLEKGGQITLEGKKGIKLSGGTLEETAKGKVSLSGQEFEAAGQMGAKLSGQSRLELSSGGITQVKGGTIKLNG